MLKKRIIPIVLLDGFSVLKTINFDTRRNLGSPITVLRTYNTRNVDELILLDIDATKHERSIDIFTVQDIVSECFMPLTVGGGIKSIEDIEAILRKGADKVAINTEALNRPSLISEAAQAFGSQSIVISINVVKSSDGYAIYKNGSIYNEKSLEQWCIEACSLGAGELLINSVDLDGTMTGGDIVLAEYISNLVSIPVIYAGGISTPENCANIAKSNISALGISSIFHFTSTTPNECKLAMHRQNIPVRLK